MMQAAVLAVALGITPLFVVALPAGPTTVDDCKLGIIHLQAATSAVPISGQNTRKERAVLLSKLVEAQFKLDQLNFSGAIEKLVDFQSRVTALAAKGRMTRTDAAFLIQGADDAIACIRQLMDDL